MAQQHGGPQGGGIATPEYVGKGKTSLDHFSGTGKTLDQARQDLTAIEDFELQHTKERVKRARDRKEKDQRMVEKMPNFDQGSDQFHDGAYLSSEEDDDGDEEQDARLSPEAAQVPDRSKDKELTQLIRRYLDPGCNEARRESLGESIQTTLIGMDDAGRHAGFTLIHAKSDEARKCAQDYWAEKLSEAEAIDELDNIRNVMTDYHAKMGNPESWVILEPKGVLEAGQKGPGQTGSTTPSQMDWENTGADTNVEKRKAFDFFGAVGEYCPRSPVAILGWKNGGGNQKLYVVEYGASSKTYRIEPGIPNGIAFNPSIDNNITRNAACNDKLTTTATLKSTVKNVLGVAWKYQDDDDFPYEYLNPERHRGQKHTWAATQTQVYVEWKDGRKTWETRTALRRISRGGASAVDKLLYLFTKNQTENYRNENEPETAVANRTGHS